MPRLNAANNARTMLTQAIDADVTSFTVADASIFPVPPFRITIDNEIMEVGAKDDPTNTFSSVLRGQEGTTAASHADGAVVENRLTAETYGELATQASLDAHLADYAKYVPQPIYNVMGFGAKGDGETDDTTAIQAAINDTPSFGVCYLPAPTNRYRVTSEIALKSNLTVLAPYGAEIYMDTPNKQTFVIPADAENIAIIGVKFTGTGAVSVQGRASIQINPTADITCKNIYIANCRFNNPSVCGISGQQVEFLTIVNNLAENVGEHGIYLSGGSKNCLILGNRILNPAQIGIQLRGNLATDITNISIINNEIYNPGSIAGILVGGEANIFTGNRIVGTDLSGVRGIRVGYDIPNTAPKSVIDKNIITGFASAAIEIDGSSPNLSITQNKIYNNPGGGIYLRGTDVLVADNDIVNNDPYGIAWYNAQRMEIKRNQVSGHTADYRDDGGTTNIFCDYGKKIAYGSAAPTEGTWNTGDIVYNIAPSAGGKIGWVCVDGGTPGTWKPFGAIDDIPAARVYHSVDQSVPDETLTALAFDSERFDNDNIHDTETNNTRLTCNTSGKYLIIGCAVFDVNDTGYRRLLITLNDDSINIGETEVYAVSGDWTTLTVSTVYQLAQDDYVELKVMQNSGAALNVLALGNRSPEFMMVRVG